MRPVIERQCVGCGARFTVRTDRVWSGGGLYCGRRCANRRQSIDPDGRFWARVNATDSCWLWLGPRTSDGYGYLSVKNTRWLAHRYARFGVSLAAVNRIFYQGGWSHVAAK